MVQQTAIFYKLAEQKLKTHNMKNRLKTISLLLIAVGIINGCGKDDSPDGPLANPLTQKVNEFIQLTMTEWYYWYDDLPNIDPRYELDSKAYFYKLLTPEDTEKEWSYITDDVDALLASLEQGEELTYGWSFAFGKFEGMDKNYAVIEYVVPNSPADKAGIKRGDILMEIAGSPITNDNFSQLYGSAASTFTLGVKSNGTISKGNEISVAAVSMNIDPVQFFTTLTEGGHKIGYLVYNQFSPYFNNSLNTAFQRFAAENVSDLVVDLRYNPGGLLEAAEHLCSCIAPTEYVNENAVLIELIWNRKRQIEFEDGQIMHNLERYLDKSVPVKLNLNNVHILTSNTTAAASELVIAGLIPLMPGGVKTVGKTTLGKYTFTTTRQPADIYTNAGYYEDIKNWALLPVTGRYTNSLRVTEFKDGFAPSIEVMDDLANPLPLGNIEEPLLKAAIEDITGTTIVASKSAGIRKFARFEKIDGGLSKFDKARNELPLFLKTTN